MSEQMKADFEGVNSSQRLGNNTADILQNFGFALVSFFGRSMYPMLRYETDKVLIEQVKRPLRKYDIVLYPDERGKFVLHRIIKINNGKYIIRGDNNLFYEYGITDSKIIGVLKGFYRGKKYIDCETNKGYKLYVFVITHTFAFRYLWVKHLRPFASKIKHTLFK